MFRFEIQKDLACHTNCIFFTRVTDEFMRLYYFRSVRVQHVNFCVQDFARYFCGNLRIAEYKVSFSFEHSRNKPVYGSCAKKFVLCKVRINAEQNCSAKVALVKMEKLQSVQLKTLPRCDTLRRKVMAPMTCLEQVELNNGLLSVTPVSMSRRLRSVRMGSAAVL